MMTETKTFYEKNEYFLDSPVNILFEDLLEMTPDEFTRWVIDMRKTVVDIWDNNGIWNFSTFYYYNYNYANNVALHSSS